jgi:hypothetical protein
MLIGLEIDTSPLVVSLETPFWETALLAGVAGPE